MSAPLPTYGHTWAGLALWGVPLSVVDTLLIRRSAPVAAAHLRGWWREYGVLGQVRHRWYVTVVSAWLGAVTHRLWDDVTHDGLAGTSLGFAVLGRPMVPGLLRTVPVRDCGRVGADRACRRSACGLRNQIRGSTEVRSVPAVYVRRVEWHGRC
ncbi:DUF4184 family protein [Streptomyces sp. NPDC002685]|uniref:DUF4184 family protein n=1 Tax=Streptomyces sp. NPDC002685 TaxID=3154540 RepID=UPI0033267BA4